MRPASDQSVAVRLAVLLWALPIVGIAGSRAAAAADAPARRHALVVGVQSYAAAGHAADGLTDLRYAEADAEGLAAVLKDHGYDVVLMTRARSRDDDAVRPTAARVLRQLDNMLIDPALDDKDGAILVAFAGHGAELKVVREGSEHKEFFFIPLDGELSRPETLVSIDQVYRKLERCNAGTRIVLADACRNDPTRRARAASATMPDVPPPPGGLLAYFSCLSAQQAMEDEALGHGVFFHFVIEGLGGAADANGDGAVYTSELTAYVTRHVYDHVRARFRTAQVPELKGTDRMSVLVRGVNAAPAAQADPGTLANYRDRIGRSFLFDVTGAADGGSIWGDGVYTDDSPLAVAAVHAGVLRDGERGRVRVTILAGRDQYAGAERNGITSQPYAAFGGSYEIQPPESAHLTAAQYRNRTGETIRLELTGSTDGRVWGTDLYADDSSLAAAAVHAGLLRAGEHGTIYITLLGGRPEYEGSTRNGVTSLPWGAWDGSVRLSKVKPVAPGK